MFTLLILSDGAKAVVGKTTVALGQVKVTAPEGTCVHGISHCPTLKAKTMSSMPNVLDEAINLPWWFINFIKSCPWVHTFLIFCETKMGNMQKNMLLYYDGCLKEKHLYNWVPSWTSQFFHRMTFLVFWPFLNCRWRAPVTSRKTSDLIYFW